MRLTPCTLWALYATACASATTTPIKTTPATSTPPTTVATTETLPPPAEPASVVEPVEPPLPHADDPDAVRELMIARGAEVRRCYTRELRNQPSLRGRMLVQFTVHPDGAIGGVRFRDDTIRSPRVRACVSHVLASVRFAPGSERVSFRYPLVFAPE